MEFSKILVAIDGSPSSTKAFEKSIYLAVKCNSKLDIVHVVPCGLGGDSATTFELIENLKTGAMNLLDECKRVADENKVSINMILKTGDPAKTIIEIANSENYDLIIMGSRGQTPFHELLLGSVSLKVSHHAKCPVMIVR